MKASVKGKIGFGRIYESVRQGKNWIWAHI